MALRLLFVFLTDQGVSMLDAEVSRPETNKDM